MGNGSAGSKVSPVSVVQRRPSKVSRVEQQAEAEESRLKAGETNSTGEVQNAKRNL